LCFYDNGSIKRYLTIKNQNLRLALSKSYRTLWMDNFESHLDHKVLVHNTTLQLREFKKSCQTPEVKAAWPVKQRKTALPTTKVPKLELEQEDASALNLNVKKQKPKLELAINNQEPPVPYGEKGNPEIITGVIKSIGINPRRRLFGILIKQDGKYTSEKFYGGGNIKEELIRTNAAINDRITLRGELDMTLCGLQGDEENESSTNHITYEIEKENELCIAHTP